MTLALAASFAALSPAASFADSQNQLSEADFLNELPTVLSASRLQQPLAEAPGAVTVIDREMIAASGAREIADLFRLVPGFQVAYAGGPNPVVAYHGLTGQYSRRMQVLVDGRSLYSPNFVGGVDWNHIGIAIEDIERIEVVRGTNTAAYGSNAFLGIANIIARDASQTHGVRFGLRSGNTNIDDNMLRVGGRVGDVDWRATISRRRDSGFEPIPDDRRAAQVNMRADWRISPTDELQLQFGLTETAAEKGEFGEAGNPPSTENNASNFVLAKWRRASGPNDETSLTFSHTWDSNGDSGVLSTTTPVPPFGLVRLEADLDGRRRSYRDHLEFQRVQGLADDLRIAWGIELRHEAARSRYGFNSTELRSASTRRTFGNLEWRLTPNLIVNASGMLEDYSLTGARFAPRLAANWRLTSRHALRAALAQAYRTPSLFEESGDLRITPSRVVVLPNGPTIQLTPAQAQALQVRRFRSAGGLRPERIRVGEIGYAGEIETWNTTLDVRFFNEHLDHLIAIDRLPELVRNRDTADLTGIDYHLRMRPLPAALIVFSQSLVRTRSTNSDLADSVPNHMSSLLVAYRFSEKLDASLAHYWVDKTHWLGNAMAVPGYRRLDLRIAKRFTWQSTQAELALVVQNQLQTYAEFSDVTLFKRRCFATLAIEY